MTQSYLATRPEVRPEALYEAIAREGLKRGLISQSTFVGRANAQQSAADVQRYSAGHKNSVESPIYARIGNPNNDDLAAALLALEGVEAFTGRTTSCGMAAVKGALFGAVKSGDHVVASRHLFGACTSALKKLESFGVAVTFIDGFDPQEWQDALRPNTRLFFFETPSNPLLHLVDIAAVAEIAHKNRDILVVVDNSFVSPLAQKPSALGADIVCYSLTKYFSGGDFVGGAVIISREGATRLQRLDPDANNLPTNKFNILNELSASDALSPVNAFHFLGQLLTLRDTYHQQALTARLVAEHIEAHYPLKVFYPTLKSHPQQALALKQMLKDEEGNTLGGGVFSLDCASREKAFDVINALCDYGFASATNFGQRFPIVAHQASNTFGLVAEPLRLQCGITEGIIRVSPGLEDAAYVIAAFDDVLGTQPSTQESRWNKASRHGLPHAAPY